VIETWSLDDSGLSPEALTPLPDGMRRMVARFFLRWGRGDLALPVLPEHDLGPRDRFDRCRALLGAGELDAARDLARELVNMPDAGHWGHRAVGEVFLAMEKPHRADERFRAGADPVGRARAWLMLDDPERALAFLQDAEWGDPETEAVRGEALRRLGGHSPEIEARLRVLFEDEHRELLEAVGAGEMAFPAPAGLPPSDPEGLRAALQRLFGYPEFRPGQLDIILPLINRESVLGLMPTGAGKSLCFQLPAALLPGATVVISPLIALMKDQVEGLPPALYRRATLVNSSLEPGEAERRLDLIARGEVSLIYAAPERLRHWPFVRALQRRGVSLFVVDEAHCVSLWGHDFRPDYFFIRQVLRDLGRPTVLALTATATPEMQEDIGRQLDVSFRRVNLGTFRPNLQLSAHKLASDVEKRIALLELLRSERGPAIIYVDRRKLTEELALKLREEGIAAEAYHAGMDKGARDRTQSRFMQGGVRVIVATVAFGMGVDKADVRLVVHYNLPRSLEAYYQEAGRAGRDGLPARCVLLYTSYDRSNLTRRTAQDRLQAAEVISIHRALSRRLKNCLGAVSAEELEKECAVAQGGAGVRVRVGISLLQGIGALDRGYDLPGSVWLALRKDEGGRMKDEGAHFHPSSFRLHPFRRLMASIGLSRPGKAVSLAAGQLAAAAGLPLDQLEPALLDWQEAGWIHYRSGSRGMGLRAAPGSRDLLQEVNKVLRQMTEMDARRLQLLAAYLESGECRQGFVSRYFGRELPEGCGVCDKCRLAAQGQATDRVAERRTDRLPYRAPSFAAPQSDEESSLFELLRAWRRDRAQEEGIPPFVIFHDRVLYAIAHARPKTLPALAEVPGVGPTKLRAYGEEVLSIVRQAD
jgi:ATP-dependent DNA helicase RecQ